ncbi:aryl-alcohol dehydrogenase-like predicted oxidoreductase [Paucibacter oligotrophus]|uniref:Aryl-alcohol dehydrogenase-like predicted oxidoreductase n=1 Tax=Roseateles oligotrophus TaxID=1769250 RepID=A0A840L385_9BURK|nr:aldo/keto reductase [Roseateles oligotrophus]MBB4842406.1 aryl-alcohol dehydrogenase-like predicted oxidoreductase [Roseateles oligotrophus]
MELALGTVQFGLAYGIAGSGQAVPDQQVRQILATAKQHGVRTLDTASAYGDIEQRLADLCGDHDFNAISKIAPVPAELDGATAAAWVLKQAQQSRQRLGGRLKGLMLHRADDLLDARTDRIWPALERWAAAEAVELGVSCYNPATCLHIRERLPIQLAQLPGNAFDQRLPQALPSALPDLQVHLRSAFLQGLLLINESVAAQRLPAAAPALRRWHDWCTQRDLTPLVAALSVVKSFDAVATVLVGVDSVTQLEQIVTAWAQARAIKAPELVEQSLAVIDPRSWKQ